jgi:DnaJ like chaperone protein
MQWTGKVIGLVIGFFIAGPFGAVIGLFLGHLFDQQARRMPAGPGLESAAISDRFFRTAFQVMGHVAKADGRVSEREIEAARSVMSDLRLNPAQVQVAIAHFTEGKHTSFALESALQALHAACADRPDLLRIFLEIQVRAALAGNDISPPARQRLQRVASLLDISAFELAHIEAALRIRRGAYGRAASETPRAARLEEAYSVLGVSASVSDDELAKAYRRQLSRHHPDKLKANGLPESMLEHAKERTQQIIEAYELIRAARARKAEG